MYNVGVFPLKALPPHRGHLKQIIRANKLCLKLYIVISDNEDRAASKCEKANLPYMPLEIRKRWLQNEFKDLDNICICILDEEGLLPYPTSSLVWSRRLIKLIHEPIDAIFGGDIEYLETYEEHLPGAVYEHMDRSEYPISSTDIRSDYLKYFEFILDSAKPFFKLYHTMSKKGAS